MLLIFFISQTLCSKSCLAIILEYYFTMWFGHLCSGLSPAFLQLLSVRSVCGLSPALLRAPILRAFSGLYLIFSSLSPGAPLSGPSPAMFRPVLICTALVVVLCFRCAPFSILLFDLCVSVSREIVAGYQDHLDKT